MTGGALVAGMVVAGSALVLGEFRSRTSRARSHALLRLAGADAHAAPVPETSRRRRTVARTIETALARCPRWLTPRREAARVAELLDAAGLRARLAPSAFLALRALAGGAAVGVGFALGVAGGGGALASALSLGLLGAAAPEIVLRRRIASRRARVEAAVPETLDLLALCVEAGLGLDAALARIVEATQGPLADELRRVLAEIRVGDGRRDALQRMGTRLAVPSASSFVRAVVRGEQLGFSLGATMRTQAEDARRRRQAEVEEQAGRAPVKMLVPTALFIFPALFVIILAPALLTISAAF